MTKMEYDDIVIKYGMKFETPPTPLTPRKGIPLSNLLKKLCQFWETILEVLEDSLEDGNYIDPMSPRK